MQVYRIAELNILIEPVYEATKKQLASYAVSCKTPDFEVYVQEEEIKEKSTLYDSSFTPQAIESALILSKICNIVLEKYNGFFFHSSSLELDGEAYVFSAPSGTGKSTHTALWREHFGDRVTMINDDKPIIRKTDDGFFIYGTPWMGKSGIGNNIKVPVKAVFILQRGKENSAVRVKTGDVFKQIFSATVIPHDRTKMSALLTLLDEFFLSVPLYLLSCNISDDAVTTAYNVANNIIAKDND